MSDIFEEVEEDLNRNGALDPGEDTDMDGRPDRLDTDDDGDGLLTAQEAPDANADGDPADARDTDGDATADYLETDDDGDGFCEVHVNTTEGFWSLLRSWLRPHRGISQEKLPLYLGFFQFVHNTRRRGKALLGTLVAALIA